MKEGDVMMLDDTSEATHVAIALGQALFSFSSGKRSITHAGLYDGGGAILEASGSAGLRSANIVSKNPGYRYQIWRYVWPNPDAGARVAQGAAHFARRIIRLRTEGPNANSGQQKYSKAAALRGLFGNSSRHEGAMVAEWDLYSDPDSIKEWYCSMFVVGCYNASTLPVPIDRDFRYITTKELHAYFKADSKWTQVGVYTV
jgi:hypothetical protein